MRSFFLFIFCAFIGNLWAQNTLNGVVKDENNNLLFAVNVYLKNKTQIGTTTQFDGKFTLTHQWNENDTLVFSFIGFQTKEIALPLANKELQIVLQKQSNSISAVEIVGNKSVSANYAIETLEALDIYLNPLSGADPLRAVNTLAGSTNTKETANPNLRGSSADRTRVVFNQIPIYKPVRNSQINGLGSFSLFNTALMDREEIYVSNPPLTFGNTSAGLVSIKTKNNLEEFDKFQLSLSLANIGFLLQEPLGKKGFVQAYSNLQFHNAFTAINQKAYKNVNGFGSVDFGANFRFNFNKKWSINAFNYFLKENYDVEYALFHTPLTSVAKSKRNFTILNLEKKWDKIKFSINQGFDLQTTRYAYGNIKSNTQNNNFHTALLTDVYFSEQHSLSFGANYEYKSYLFQGQNPIYSHTVEKPNLVYLYDTLLSLHFAELFAYYNYYGKRKQFSFSAGVRTGSRLNQFAPYISYQASLNYKPHKAHSILFSAGYYNNFSIPYSFRQSIFNQNAYQVALDYAFRSKNYETKIGAYYKIEQNEEVLSLRHLAYRQQNILGVEFQQKIHFLKHFSFDFIYTYLYPKLLGNKKWVNSPEQLNYFFKTALSFGRNRWVNVNLTYLLRNGLQYQYYTESIYEPSQQIYFPNENSLAQGRFNVYQNLSLSISKYIAMKKNTLVLFCSINNLLDNTSQQRIYYNKDYSHTYFDHFQRRSIYFGLVFSWKSF